MIEIKYLKNISVGTWIRNSIYYSSGASIVWTSFLKVNHLLNKGICWNIGNGKSVITGIDPFVGDKDCPYFPEEITEHLS